MTLPRRPLLHAALGLAALTLALPALAQAQAPAAAPPAAAPAAPAAPVVVTLETSQGRIVLELDAKAAPRTTANFVQYVKDGYYEGTIFHRVIPGFMAQAGGYTAARQPKAGLRAPIAIESNNGLHNQRGSIAMARTSNPDSASSQFFINVVDNGNLDYPGMDGFGYTVFGRVTEGMDVVDRIVAVPTRPVGFEFQNLPVQPIVIQKARLGS